jgi:AraC-like DNA-binding protein
LNGDDKPRSKGHLNPAESAPISRYPVEPDLASYVRHFWVPEWELEPGTSVTARVLGYPTLNLVVDPELVIVTGPTRRESQRVLEGRGWAVGVLLQPAATPALGYDAERLVDAALPLDEPSLRAAVVVAMSATGSQEERHLAAVAVVSAWLRERLGEHTLTDQGLLANRAVEIVEGDPTLTRVADLAARLHVSERTLQRVVRRCTGFTPAEVVRRRRLQEATDRIRRGDAADLSEVAQEVGYADHAHVTRDFRAALEEPPSQFRRHH